MKVKSSYPYEYVQVAYRFVNKLDPTADNVYYKVTGVSYHI